MENDNINKIEANAARALLERGARYSLGEDDITIRPLKFGTVLSICQLICEADMTLEQIDKAEENMPPFVAKHADTMLAIVAISILNTRAEIEDAAMVNQKKEWLAEHITMFQIYELFMFIVNLSGMTSFINTIRLAFAIKTTNLSPRVQGS